MTFLHILPSDTIRTYRVIELIVANFDITAHRFLITEDEKHVATHYPLLLEFKLPNIMFLKRPQKNRFLEKMAIIRSIGNQMKGADVIVWHSFAWFSNAVVVRKEEQFEKIRVVRTLDRFAILVRSLRK